MTGNSSPAYAAASSQQRRWWPCTCGHPAVNHQASASGKTITWCTIQTGPRPCGCRRFTPADADPGTVLPPQLRRLCARDRDGICTVCGQSFLDMAGPCPGPAGKKVRGGENGEGQEMREKNIPGQK